MRRRNPDASLSGILVSSSGRLGKELNDSEKVKWEVTNRYNALICKYHKIMHECTPGDIKASTFGRVSEVRKRANVRQWPRGVQSKVSSPTGAMPGEMRAEKLKREYTQKNASPSNRVWDDIDQRWVEGPVKNGERSTTATPSPLSTAGSMIDGMDGTTAAVKGITLSRDNATGKSANVQAAVHARIDDMEKQQQKAITELRIREGEKAKNDSEEDSARQRLEPRLKAWSEEHGQKKQLRALLANLHTILWEDSGWKPISLADVLDDSKVKKVYHQASRVVHPDKTGHLDAEKRFVAKRVFDALTQAKVEFDEGKR